RSGRPGEAVAPLDTPTGSLPAPGRRPSGLDTAAATQFHGADREVPMRSDRVLSTIDFHTAGIGMRLLTTGLGRLPGATSAETRVVIDTEAGAVETVARSEGDRVREVTLKWTPSFVVLADQVVEVEGVGEVPLDVAVGVGNVFAVVDAERLGVAVRREQVKKIAQRGMAVREAVNAQLQVDVPGVGKTSVDNVLVHELPDAHGVSPNALVWGPGQVDAAPCGSGTCARMALFHHRGVMAVGSTFVSRGLLGLDFTGRIAGETAVEGRPAILPEITGTSY